MSTPSTGSHQSARAPAGCLRFAMLLPLRAGGRFVRYAQLDDLLQTYRAADGKSRYLPRLLAHTDLQIAAGLADADFRDAVAQI